jgi:hypothetical protein
VAYAFERVDVRNHNWPANIVSNEAGTIFQMPAWLAFLSRTQHGEVVVAALRDGGKTVGYFIGMIVRKFGVRILGSPFPGWSTDYMGFALPPRADRRQAVRALLYFAFEQLRCVHLEMMDRNLTVSDLEGLGVEYRMYRGFEIDLTRDEDKLFSNMTSACRRCIRKAQREGVSVEEVHGLEFANEYYAQLQDVFLKQGLIPTYGIDRVQQLITHVHSAGHVLLLRARNPWGRSIATGIFLHMNGVMYFWGGASLRQHQILRPNEAIQWHAIKLGRKIGLHTYDMGGGGEHKRKYGGSEIGVPWFRKSKYRWIGHLRDLMQQSHKVRQRCLGRLNRLYTREGLNNRPDEIESSESSKYGVEP